MPSLARKEWRQVKADFKASSTQRKIHDLNGLVCVGFFFLGLLTLNLPVVLVSVIGYVGNHLQGIDGDFQ